MKKSTDSSGKTSSAIASRNTIEKISNLSFDGEELSMVVSSNGCTKAEDFSIQYELIDRACMVKVVRSKPDNCRKASHPVRIAIAWEKPAQCTEADLVFTNPLLEFQKSPASRSSAASK